MSGESLSGCAKCAALGKTCCQSREILVTEGDKARIKAFAGREDAWEFQPVADPAYMDQDDDPHWLEWAFRADGSRLILKRRPNDDCEFLSTSGCTLPMEVRPLVCRLYPFTYTERGLSRVDDECPSEAIPPGQTILQVLDLRLADAVRWHHMLYTELRTKEPFDVDRADLRPTG